MQAVNTHTPSPTIRLLENLVGRRTLWRIGRGLYRYARRDASGDPATNGEYLLHLCIAQFAVDRGLALVVIDVGANTGYWSAHLIAVCQRLAVSSLKLWAFEPSDEIRARLTKELKSSHQNYRVTIRREAVGEKVGFASFGGVQGIVGTNHLLTEASNIADKTLYVEVPMTTLADFFAEEGIEAALYVKSDVEGFDFGVIKGALPLLKGGRIGVLQFEYNHRWVTTRTFLKDVFDLTQELPYSVCRIVPDGLERYVSWHPELETFFETNFALVRDDLLEPLRVSAGDFDRYNTYEMAGRNTAG